MLTDITLCYTSKDTPREDMKTSIIAPSRFVARSRTPLGGSLRRAAVCKGGLKGGRRATVRCTLAPLVREPGVAEGSLPVLSFVDRVDGSSSQVRRGLVEPVKVPGVVQRPMSPAIVSLGC